MNISFEKVVWVAGFLGHCLLVFVVVARQRWRGFPVFSALIAYHVPFSIIVWSVIRFRANLYSTVYWIEEFLDFALQGGLLVELASRAFRRRGVWLPETKVQLIAGSIFGIVVAGSLATALDIAELPTRDLWDMRANVFTSLLACTVIMHSSIALSRLGLHQNGHISAIARGFAFWAVTALMSDVGHMQTGWKKGTVIFDRLADAVWVCVLVYWSMALWRPEVSETLCSQTNERSAFN